MIFLDSFPDFFGRKERSLLPYRASTKTASTKTNGTEAHCSPQSRIAPVDRISILQCTKPYVHDAKRPIIAFSK
jgi:hypothetical protein